MASFLRFVWMKARILVGCVWASLIFSCENEPYLLMPLALSEFENTTTKSTSVYEYQQGTLASFVRTGAVPVSMKFIYHDGVLSQILKDSTDGSYQLIDIYGYGSPTAVDSTFTVTADTTILNQVRTLTYDGEQLSRIDLTQWTDVDTTQVAYELDWSDGNVSQLRTISIVDGVETEYVLSLNYDQQVNALSGAVPYVYTIDPSELYWLSSNNPVIFQGDTLPEKRYTYYYNQEGYPSHIVTDTKHILALSYIELR